MPSIVYLTSVRKLVSVYFVFPLFASTDVPHALPLFSRQLGIRPWAGPMLSLLARVLSWLSRLGPDP
jgi:hypothetical protein